MFCAPTGAVPNGLARCRNESEFAMIAVATFVLTRLQICDSESWWGVVSRNLGSQGISSRDVASCGAIFSEVVSKKFTMRSVVAN